MIKTFLLPPNFLAMKYDMAGAAAVLGAFCTLVKNGFKEELHCLLCIAENMIGPDAKYAISCEGSLKSRI